MPKCLDSRNSCPFVLSANTAISRRQTAEKL